MADIRRFVANTDIGQNFLVDRSVVDYIIKQAALKEGDLVLEIGPGKGILTEGLLSTPCSLVHSVELDTRLKPELEKIAVKHPRFQLTGGDALQVDYDVLFPNAPTHLIANLPYHITTPLLWTLIEKLAARGLTYILVMVQLEAAQRLVPEAKKRERCPLGITFEAMGKAKLLRKVSRTAFKPAPQVESALIEVRLTQELHLPNYRPWRRLLAASFTQRRKTLINNWLAGYPISRERATAILEELNLTPMARPEELTLTHWEKLVAIDDFTH